MVWAFNNGLWVREGVLDNTIKDKTTGRIEFAGIGSVVLDLIGNMEGSLYGKRLRFHAPEYNQDACLSGSEISAYDFLKNYGMWNKHGEIIARKPEERKIKGRVRIIEADDIPLNHVDIQYYNTHYNTSKVLDDQLSVIHSVPYEII